MVGADVLGIETKTWGGIVLGAATLIGAAALLVVAEALRRWYRHTLGRRQDRYERLARLGTGAHLAFFTAVLGEPPAMSRSFDAEVEEYEPGSQRPVVRRRDFREHFFIDRDYYVQAFCDVDETVLAFSVTTRSKRFAPTFSFPPRPGRRARRKWKKETGQRFRYSFKVKLGRTRFSALRGENYRPQRRVDSGARTYTYTEALYLGNPGYYQHYCFTASTAAPRAPLGPVVQVAELLGYRQWVGGIGDENAEQIEELEVLNRFRDETAITTYTVLGPHLQPGNYPASFGPHGDEVRTLP